MWFVIFVNIDNGNYMTRETELCDSTCDVVTLNSCDRQQSFSMNHDESKPKGSVTPCLKFTSLFMSFSLQWTIKLQVTELNMSVHSKTISIWHGEAPIIITQEYCFGDGKVHRYYHQVEEFIRLEQVQYGKFNSLILLWYIFVRAHKSCQCHIYWPFIYLRTNHTCICP